MLKNIFLTAVLMISANAFAGYPCCVLVNGQWVPVCQNMTCDSLNAQSGDSHAMCLANCGELPFGPTRTICMKQCH